ncbi:hypothetical protein EGY07_11205 [Chryseobacterium indologenes]|uniref:hypothetical protein n=1 Tax=Chryseobacterium indologenes TaxID=253 RepID=UPI000F507C38|nr:hypothetical protein [Chryseobacterium indologenes]AYZ36102.1 hypothetical protein EGY07_11205 [Chryseobacterium indologenes]MEB4760730.1 hypothetical protein [Chryseobacterium indologenes]
MQIKPLALILIVVFQLFSINTFSQKTAGLNALLDKNSEFIFPQTTDRISKILNSKTIFYEDANEEKYASWTTKSGLELYCSLGKNNSVNEMFFDVPDDKFLIVEGLPFGLALNKSTLKDAQNAFGKYGAKSEKLDNGSQFPGGTKLVFKKSRYYATLFFDHKNLLKSLGLTTELIDPAAN